MGKSKLASGSTVHLVKIGQATTSTTSQSAGPAAPASSQTESEGLQLSANELRQVLQQQQQQQLQQGASGAQSNPLAGLLGSLPQAPGGGMPQMSSEQMNIMSEFVANNPELVRSVMQADPRFRALAPEMQQMMLSPEFLRVSMAAAPGLAASGALPGGFPGIPAMPPVGGAGQEAPPSAAELEQFRAIAEAMTRSGYGPQRQGQPEANAPAPSSPQEPPEVRFQAQLAQLNEMGFWDPEENIQTLLLTGGMLHQPLNVYYKKSEPRRDWC